MVDNSVEVVFGAETAELQAGLKQAKASIENMGAALSKAAAQANVGEVANENLAQSFGKASTEVQKFHKQLDAAANFAWNNTGFSGNEIERIVNPIKGLSSAIGVVPTLAAAASAAIAALALAVGAFAENQLEKIAEITKETGIGANELQGAKIVGARSGVDSDAMTAGLKNASQQFEQFKRNAGEVKDSLEKVDEAFLKVADKAKTSGEFIDIVGQEIRNLPREEGIDLAKALFGDDTGQKLYEPIIRGQLEMQKLGQAAQTAGVALDDGVVKAAREAQMQIDETAAKTSGKLLQAFQGLAPPVAAVKLEFYHVVDAIADATTAATKFANELHEALVNSQLIAKENQQHQTGGVPFKDVFAPYRRAVVSSEVQGPPAPGQAGQDAGVSRARYAARDAADDKAKAAKSPRENGDALAAARKEIDGEIEAVKQQTQINIAQYDLDFANKKITEEEKKRLVQQANNQEFAAIEALYAREKQLSGQKPAQIQDINNKIEALESQHQVKMLELQTKEIQDAAKLAHDQAQQMADTLTSSLSQALIGAVEHTRTKDAGKKLAQSLFSDLANEFAKNTLTEPLEKALEPAFQKIGDLITQPIQDAIKKALGGITSGLSSALGSGAASATSAVAAGAAGSAAASGAGTAALSTAGIGLSSSAAELTAAAAALSSAAAAIGAGGATAGAGGAAAAGGGLFSGIGSLLKGFGLPGFDVGTNYVPRDMPAFIHQGERIVPAADNRALMGALNGGARGGGNTTNVNASPTFNISTMDSRSISRFLNSNNRAIMKSVSRAVQQGAHLGLKGLT